MLSVSRKHGDELRIMGLVTLQFHLPKGGRVKVSVDAPVAARVIRVEVDEDGACVNDEASLEELYAFSAQLNDVQNAVQCLIAKHLEKYGVN